MFSNTTWEGTWSKSFGCTFLWLKENNISIFHTLYNIYWWAPRATHSAITTESVLDSWPFFVLPLPSTIFSSLFFVCFSYVMWAIHPSMERPRTGITPLIDISSLLPKNNCSAPAGGEVYKPQNLVFPYIYICIAFKTIS